MEAEAILDDLPRARTAATSAFTSKARATDQVSTTHQAPATNQAPVTDQALTADQAPTLSQRLAAEGLAVQIDIANALRGILVHLDSGTSTLPARVGPTTLPDDIRNDANEEAAEAMKDVAEE